MSLEVKTTKAAPKLSMQPRWRQDALQLFLLTAFPIHVWSYYNVMREFPAWLARFNTGDLIATIGFSQLMPLLESLLIFIPVLLGAALLPRRFDKAQRIALVFCFLMISSAWAIFFHYTIDIIREWRLEFIGLGLLYLATNVLPIMLIMRSRAIAESVAEAIERVNVLSAIYLAVDAVCVLIVVGFLLL